MYWFLACFNFLFEYLLKIFNKLNFKKSVYYLNKMSNYGENRWGKPPAGYIPGYGRG